MTIAYGWEKFSSAVNCLTMDADLSDRITLAFTHNLIHLDAENDLPNGIKDEFIELMAFMRSVEATADEGLIRAKIETMGVWEMNQLCNKIVSIYGDICKYRGKEEL